MKGWVMVPGVAGPWTGETNNGDRPLRPPPLKGRCRGLMQKMALAPGGETPKEVPASVLGEAWEGIAHETYPCKTIQQRDSLALASGAET